VKTAMIAGLVAVSLVLAGQTEASIQTYSVNGQICTCTEMGGFTSCFGAGC